MAPTYKLTYFDVQGIAESIRFLFNYGGIEYEDVRIPLEGWSEIKQNYPFGQLPVMEVDGKVFPQSMSIARYVAKQVKLAGKTDLEDLEIDGVVDSVMDLRVRFAVAVYGDNEANKEAVFTQTIPYYLERFNKFATDNNGYLALGRLTWADLLFIAMLEYMGLKAEKGDLIAKYPALVELRKKVLNIPNIKAWIQKRPKTAF